MAEDTAVSAAVRRVEPVSVVDRVVKEIRRAILGGALQPGRQFSLREVADQLGVSFIPVREALHHLESQGLVVTSPGKSAVVAPLSHADLRGIYRLRRQIEPELAGRACLLLTDADHRRLAAYLPIFGDAALGMDEVYEAHHDFHLELLRPAATSWDLRTVEMLGHAAERYIRLTFGGLDTDPHEPRRREQSHTVLLDAVRRRDPGQAAQALLEHLDRNEQIAQQGINAIAS